MTMIYQSKLVSAFFLAGMAGCRVITVCFLGLVLIFIPGCQSKSMRPTPPVPPPHSISQAVTLPSPPPPAPEPVSWQDFDRAAAFYVTGRHDQAGDLINGIYQLPLSESQQKQLNILGGINAYKGRRYEEAVKYLDHPEQLPDSLRSYALYYRGLAGFELGDYQGARSLLSQSLTLDPTNPFANRARLTMAIALYRQGQAQTAISEAQGLVKTDLAGLAWLTLAHMHETTDQRTARDYYQKAMKESNLREVRAEASRKYEELLAPVADQAGQEDLKLDLARLLRTEWRLDECVQLADKLLAQGGSDNYLGELQSERARALFFSGQLDQSMAYYRQTFSGNAYSAWMYARNLDRMGDWEKAAQAYLMAAKAYGKSGRAQSAYFEAGLILLHLGRREEAEKVWAGAGRDYQDEILWHLGFHYYHAKQWGQAAEYFKAIPVKYSKSPFAQGAIYWLAVSLDNGGQKKMAQDHFRNLAGSQNDYYYRMLAEQRLGWIETTDECPDLPVFQSLMALGEPDPNYSFPPLKGNSGVAVGRSCWAHSSPGIALGELRTEQNLLAQLQTYPAAPAAFNQRIIRLRDAAQAGLLDLAYLEAKTLRSLIKNSGSANIQASDLSHLATRLFAFCSAYLAEIEDYSGFVKLQYDQYRLLQGGTTTEQKLNARRRFHPIAYPEPVLRAAEEFDLHPALILSVMRTESQYQPDVMSVANARGLMQILPATGHKIADRMGLPQPQPDDLFAPHTNIRFGAWYLAALIKEFDGQTPLAIASYNAGPFNVKRWVDQAPDCTMEEFIERIPFVQTRIYVKKILGTFYLYRSLFAGKAIGVNLGQPLRKNYLDQVNF
jgi:soluble lytic murein transglycosylase-like protein/TolA-binding protein